MDGVVARGIGVVGSCRTRVGNDSSADFIAAGVSSHFRIAAFFRQGITSMLIGTQEKTSLFLAAQLSIEGRNRVHTEPVPNRYR